MNSDDSQEFDFDHPRVDARRGPQSERVVDPEGLDTHAQEALDTLAGLLKEDNIKVRFSAADRILEYDERLFNLGCNCGDDDDDEA